MKKSFSSLFATATLLWCATAPGWSQDTTLLADINTALAPVNPASKTMVKFNPGSGEIMIMVMDDPLSGSEIWRSDGTALGTRQVIDIVPGSAGSEPDPLPGEPGPSRQLTVVGNKVFFIAQDEAGLHGLWVTNGEASGTLNLHNFPLGSRPNHLTAFNGRLIFEGYDDDDGLELWESDGTAEGTKLNKNINGVFGSGANANILDFFNYKNTYLYFTAISTIEPTPGDLQDAGRELWRMDSNFVATLYRDFKVGSASIFSDLGTSVATLNNRLYFSADDTEGAELWTADATGVTTDMQIVTDIVSSGGGSEPGSIVVVGEGAAARLYFTAFHPTYGVELWRSNGAIDLTVATELVEDILPLGVGSGVANLTPLGSTLFFTADNGVDGVEVWSTNVSGIDAVLRTNINPGDGDSLPGNLTPFSASSILFTASNSTGDLGLYSLGTAGNSNLIASLGINATASQFTKLGSSMYFLVDGKKLWMTNGTTASEIKNFINSNAGSAATNFARIGEEVYFSASNGLTGQELWKTDGTTAGTVLVRDIRTGSAGSDPANITASGGRIYFTADSIGGNRELWVTDGTEEGTVMVMTPTDEEINPGGSSNPANLKDINGVLYFSANNADLGVEPWYADETGAHLKANLVAFGVSSSPSQFVSFRNDIYFVARADAQDSQLRKWSDPFKRIVDGSVLNATTPNEVREMVVMGTGAGARLYFNGSSNKGRELWKSDGTNAGTQIIDIDTSSFGPGSNPTNLTVVGNTLYFVATRGSSNAFNQIPDLGRELFSSTGTVPGTKMVKDIYVGEGNSSDPENLTEAGGKLFFTAFTPASGRELWVSSASTGTVMVKDIRPGAASPNISGMKNVDGIIVFSADDGVHGREVWLSDGTVAGTVMLEDLALLSASSNPGGFTAFKGQVLYSATEPGAGNEPRLGAIGSNIEVQQPAGTPLVMNQEVSLPQANFKGNSTLTFTIKNTGKNTLLGVKPVISGINASEFTLVAPKAAVTVPPFSPTSTATTTMAVKFTPKEGGPRRATLSILSNDGDENPFVIQLVANGVKDPTITLHPVSLMLNVGEAAHFESAASGTGTLLTQWKKGSGAIAGQTGNTFDIAAVTIKDAGVFSFSAKGPTLTAVSNPAELGVVEDYSSPPVLAVGAGKTATVKVNAAGNQLTYKWLRKRAGELAATELADNAFIAGSATKTLTIKLVTTNDTAEYSCRVTNPGGFRIGGTTQVNVFTTAPEVLAVQNMDNGIVGGAYYHKILVNPDAEKTPLTYTVKNIPTGLKLDAKTGVISGRPTKAATFKVILGATNTFKPLVTPAVVEHTVVIAPFPTKLDGIYAGTVAHNAALNDSLGGRLDITITPLGGYSGTMMLGGSKLTVKGAMEIDVDGVLPPHSTLVLKRTSPVRPDVTLAFTVNTVDGLLTSATVTSGADTAVVKGWRRVDAATAAHYIGYYTFGMELGDPGQVGTAFAAKVPQGWSYGSFTVAKDGKLNIAGLTADGEKITCGTFVGEGGNIPFFQTMYTPLKGSLVGSLVVNPQNTSTPPGATDNTLLGDVEWARPADVKSKTRTYVGGFGMPGTLVTAPVPLEAIGSAYVKPVGKALVLDLPDPTTLNVDFTEGNLLSSRVNATITVAASNKITQDTTPPDGATKVASITGTSGAFTGTFALTDTVVGFAKPIPRKVTFKGLMIKDGPDKLGVGFFVLPELPEVGQTATTTDILGGKVELNVAP